MGMTRTQEVLIARAKANGGILRLDNSMMLEAAKRIPSDVAYINCNVLVIATKEN